MVRSGARRRERHRTLAGYEQHSRLQVIKVDFLVFTFATAVRSFALFTTLKTPSGWQWLAYASVVVVGYWEDNKRNYCFLAELPGGCGYDVFSDG